NWWRKVRIRDPPMDGHGGSRRPRAEDRYRGRACPPGKGGGKRWRDRCAGRSRGGLTARIHVPVGVQGRPIQTKLTADQAGGIASALIGRLGPGTMLLADKG